MILIIGNTFKHSTRSFVRGCPYSAGLQKCQFFGVKSVYMNGQKSHLNGFGALIKLRILHDKGRNYIGTLFRSNPIRFQGRSYASQRKLPFEINNKVNKDVMIYSYTNDKYFRLLGIFGFIQLTVFANMASLTYSYSGDAGDKQIKVKQEESPIWEIVPSMMKSKKNIVAGICVVAG